MGSSGCKLSKFSQIHIICYKPIISKAGEVGFLLTIKATLTGFADEQRKRDQHIDKT